jgi:serine/threonine protein kinase
MQSYLSPRNLLETSIDGKIVEERKGASGVVYIVDNGPNCYPRKVAYKSFQERFALDEEKKRHFIEECIKWFKLRNSYTVTPYYAEVIGGQPFICMPYCKTDLKSLIINNSLTRAEALIIITQLTKAMLALQDRGFSQHQDLNPPNILLQMPSDKMDDYPESSIENFEVLIADFGMLDLYNSLGPSNGAIGGKFPFKAPEQYTKSERDELNCQLDHEDGFKPDTFALGVIMYMLFTGKHPNDMTPAEAFNRNTSGSIFKKWALSDPIVSMPDTTFTALINSCLQIKPSNRPDLASILEICNIALHTENKQAYEFLQRRFNENDRWDSFQSRISNLEILKNISELPGQRKYILEYLMAELDALARIVSTPLDVIYYGRTVHHILLLARKNDGLDEYLIRELYALIDLIMNWHETLTIEHLYPSKNEKGESILPSVQNMRNIQAAANFTSLAFRALRKLQGAEVFERHLAGLNTPRLTALYHYFLAEESRSTDILLTIKHLDIAKGAFENEPLFDYMKFCWIEDSDAFFFNLNDSDRNYVSEELAKAKDAVVQMAPNWDIF